MRMQLPDYCFYATLLDAFRNYVDSELIYEHYWGWSENPPHTLDEFREMQFQSLINTLNRVPFDSEAADKGTAFNEVVDCLIEKRMSEKVEMSRVYNDDVLTGIKAVYNDREFIFPIALCKEFANYYKGAITQLYVEAMLPTSLGIVKLYGFIDELMPTSIHDIKTTGSYYVGKFKKHYQHLVYPYCLINSGNNIKTFEYNVAEIGKSGYKTYTELYEFNEERDIPILRNHCEELIRFIQDNRDLVTNKKLLNINE
ncbi:MAG: HNH endonuclease [Bacteroidales bacterium]|nr:HNH endonuclease [Bacteroidales bacterium]